MQNWTKTCQLDKVLDNCKFRRKKIRIKKLMEILVSSSIQPPTIVKAKLWHRNDIEKYRLKFWEIHSQLEDPLYVRQLSIHQYLEKINMICEAMEKGRMLRPSWISRFCYIRFELALRMQQQKAKEYIQQAYYFITIAEGENSPTSKMYFDFILSPVRSY